MLLLVETALADSFHGKTVLDLWDAAYLRTGKAGYIRTHVEEIERDGVKLLRATVEMSLTLKRNRDTVTLRMELGDEETPEGKVVGVFTRHYLGKQQVLHLVGTVVGKQLQLKRLGENGGPLQPAPWNDKVVGLARQQRLFQEKKLKPGDKLDILSFESSINLVVTLRIQAMDYEEVALPGSKAKQKLLHVVVSPDEIRIPKPDGRVDSYHPPAIHYWLGKDRMPVRTVVETHELGTITAYRTTRAKALAAGDTGTITDIGISQLVLLSKRIARPLEVKNAAYRITLKGDKNAASAFTRDARQKIVNARGDTFELHVQASRGPRTQVGKAKPADEYLTSSYFINSADERVQDHAAAAVGAETDPWKKALRIEKWVRKNMHFTNDEAMATADHVARTLEGDCSEHAMLAAAMCRAQGIPSRTALGLIYADTAKGPAFAFHMWAEVWVQGQWVPIDGTLGRGYVGATHIKITDQSWHDTRALTPLLPLARVVGKVKIEVLQVDGK
jgi:transglutaminase-like putative cysteine protease